MPSGFLCLEGFAKETLLLAGRAKGLNSKPSPGNQRVERWRENTWPMMGKRVFSFQMPFKFFFPSWALGIYRIQGEYSRVISSGAALGPLGSSRSHRKKLRGKDKKRPGAAGHQVAFFMSPRAFLFLGWWCQIKAYESAIDGIIESKGMKGSTNCGANVQQNVILA